MQKGGAKAWWDFLGLFGDVDQQQGNTPTQPQAVSNDTVVASNPPIEEGARINQGNQPAPVISQGERPPTGGKFRGGKSNRRNKSKKSRRTRRR